MSVQNFLFSSTSKDSELRMIDFGLSKHFRYGEVQHEAVGTPYTVAPYVTLVPEFGFLTLVTQQLVLTLIFTF